MAEGGYTLWDKTGLADLVFHGAGGPSSGGLRSSWAQLQQACEAGNSRVEAVTIDGADTPVDQVENALSPLVRDVTLRVCSARLSRPAFVYVSPQSIEVHVAEADLYLGGVDQDCERLSTATDWATTILNVLTGPRPTVSRSGWARDSAAPLESNQEVIDGLVLVAAEVHASCDSDLEDVVPSYRSALTRLLRPGA